MFGEVFILCSDYWVGDGFDRENNGVVFIIFSVRKEKNELLMCCFGWEFKFFKKFGNLKLWYL